MKRITSISMVLITVLLLTACTPTGQGTSSNALTGSHSSASDSEPAVTSSNASSSATTELPVSSTENSEASETASVSSVVSNPIISQHEPGSYYDPAPKTFYQTEELLQYLKTINLQEKGFDIIAEENICLSPKLVEHPKSKPGKVKIEEQVAFTSQTGGGPLIWAFLDAPGSWCYSLSWYTSKEDLYKPVKTPQDLYDVVKNMMPDEELQLITRGEQSYIYYGVSKVLYWMYEDKYLVHVSDNTNTLNADELILLAEDLIFEKHKVK